MTEAYDACCSLGMGLVSLETPRETNDLALFIQNLGEPQHFFGENCVNKNVFYRYRHRDLDQRSSDRLRF